MMRSGLPRAATIIEVREENYRTKTFVLDMTLHGAYPGQFAMFWLPRFDEKPFSLVNADPVTVMVTDVGPFSHLLHSKELGDQIWVRGPFGNGYHVEPDQKRIAVIGGGYGVAPLHWLARSRQDTADRVHAIIGARTAADILYANRFGDLGLTPPSATRPSLHITTEDGTLGTQGRVTDVLEPLLADRQIDAIFACGPHGMLAALEAMSQRHNVPCQLSWEAYMRCGIGVCGACEHEGNVLCMDGPVLAGAST
jgi:dihydroorotate dehydrogenase electron transfer subunit